MIGWTQRQQGEAAEAQRRSVSRRRLVGEDEFVPDIHSLPLSTCGVREPRAALHTSERSKSVSAMNPTNPTAEMSNKEPVGLSWESFIDHPHPA